MSRVLIIILIIFAVILGCLFLVPHSSLGCFETEQQKSIPAKFQNAVLEFSGTTGYYDPSGVYGCSPVLKSLKGNIWLGISDQGLQPVLASTSFTIVKVVDIGCNNLLCAIGDFNNDPAGTVVVIQDAAGNDWQLQFPVGYDSTQNNTSSEAAYYINGQQVGYVSASDFN